MQKYEKVLENIRDNFLLNQNLEDLKQQLLNLISELNTAIISREAEPQKLDIYIKNILNFNEKKKLENIIPTGFKTFDKDNIGFAKGESIIIGGRPGMGKTSFMLQLVRNFALNKTKMLFVSLELNAQQICERLMANIAGVPYKEIKKINPSENVMLKLQECAKELENYSFLILDNCVNILDLKSQCKKLIQENALDVVFIDYIQLLKGINIKSNNREFEMAQISRDLKLMAKELNICIIASSQLSRAVESRGGDKRPMLSDLRESGALEQNSDKVIMLYRPEYYGITEDENGFSLKNIMELIVAKNRNGELKNYPLLIDDNFSNINEFELSDLDILFKNRAEELN